MNQENYKDSLKESVIKENDLPFDLENTKNEITDNSISPIIYEISSCREEPKNINNNIISKNNKNSDFESKKIKLVHIYNSLLKLRQNLLIKEKELNMKEKNLFEFEKILKLNENLLKKNIEQFEVYIKRKKEEIKNQFKQIEQIQLNKENYLKQKEKEIIFFENNHYFKNNNKNFNLKENNNSKDIDIDYDSTILNEKEIIEPFIENYMSKKNNDEKNEYNNNLYTEGCLQENNPKYYNFGNEKFLNNLFISENNFSKKNLINFNEKY